MVKVLLITFSLVVTLSLREAEATACDGWGTPSQKGITTASTVVNMASSSSTTPVDYTSGGGHGTPDERRQNYNNGQYTSQEGHGVDCSGEVLTSTAVAGANMPNGTAHDIATNNNYTSAVSGDDYRKGDIIGVDNDHNGNIEHMGVVSDTDATNHKIQVTQASTSADEVKTTSWINPATDNYWGVEGGNNGGYNQHRRDP